MDRFDPGKLGDWVVFCDICGQKCYASEAQFLSTETGRGGLLVCPKDADKIDHGLIPYTVEAEKAVPFTRVNHTNTTDGTSTENLETSTSLGT